MNGFPINDFPMNGFPFSFMLDPPECSKLLDKMHLNIIYNIITHFYENVLCVGVVQSGAKNLIKNEKISCTFLD